MELSSLTTGQYDQATVTMIVAVEFVYCDHQHVPLTLHSDDPNCGGPCGKTEDEEQSVALRDIQVCI